MKKVFLVSLFFLQTAFGQGQDVKIDALFDAFIRTQYTFPDSSYQYLNKAKVVANGNESQLAECYFYFGRYYYNRGNPKMAEKWTSRSLFLADKTNNSKAKALNYNLLGLMEMDRGNFTASLKHLLKSLDIADRNTLPRNKCNALNNLGTLYEMQQDTANALKCYKTNVEIAKFNKFYDALLNSYISLGIINRAIHKEESIHYYNQAYAIANQLHDEYQKATILLNISEVYLSTDNKDNYQKAYVCLKKLKEIETKSNITDHLFYYYFNMGAYYARTANYTESVKWYQKALDLSKNKVDAEQKSSLLKVLSKVYRKAGDTEKALDYSERYHALEDSLFNIKKSKAFDEIQTQYEVEKKNLKIDLLSREKKLEQTRKNALIYLGLALVIPLIILVFFYWNRVRLQRIIRNRENELFLKEKEALQQKQELEHIAGIIEGQDQERNRIAREIHDGVGGSLAGIKFQLHQINMDMKNDSVNEVIDNLGVVFNELRAISHDLSSNTISDKSLSQLVWELIKDYENRKEFETELTIFPEDCIDNVPFAVKQHVYRVIQELLTNIAKHAKARKVLIGFTLVGNVLNIIIEDDGCGFDKVGKRRGIGLANIKERLTSINGTFQIDSVKGYGTTVVIDIMYVNNKDD